MRPALHRSAIGYVLGVDRRALPEHSDGTPSPAVVQPCADIALVPADDMAGLGTTPSQLP